MASFARQQQQMRQAVQQTFSPFIPMGVEEMGRQNLALIERAMTMFNPFHRTGEHGEGASTGGAAAAGEHGAAPAPAPASAAAPAGEASAAPETGGAELAQLRHEVESLRTQLAMAHAELVVGHAARPAPSSPIAAVAPNVMADQPETAPAAGVAAAPLVNGRGKKVSRKV